MLWSHQSFLVSEKSHENSMPSYFIFFFLLVSRGFLLFPMIRFCESFFQSSRKFDFLSSRKRLCNFMNGRWNRKARILHRLPKGSNVSKDRAGEFSAIYQQLVTQKELGDYTGIIRRNPACTKAGALLIKSVFPARPAFKQGHFVSITKLEGFDLSCV